MTKRHITPHKGGRPARIPSGRIRQQTLDRIHAEMWERGKSWADLVEEKWQGDDEMPNKMNLSKVMHGKIDEFGVFIEDANGTVKVKRDRVTGDLWCVKHNCKLGQCKQKH